MMRLPALRILAIALMLGPAPALAQDEEAPDYGWGGKGEFGLVSSSGNTDTRSLKLALEFIYDAEKWRHRMAAGVINAENSGKKTANRYDFGVQSDYKLSERSYVFGALRYEKDDFSAFEDQSTAAMGYGRQVLNSKKHKLKLEGGVGYRTATPVVTGTGESGVVFRGLVDWVWQLTPSTFIDDRFLVEAGSDNTYLQNDLGLSVAMNARFAVKLGFQLRNNTEVPPGVDKTDTLTSANLVYNF